MTKQPYLADDHVTVGEAAQLLHVSRQTVLSMILRRELTTLQTSGGHNRIPMSEISDYLERNTKPRETE